MTNSCPIIKKIFILIYILLYVNTMESSYYSLLFAQGHIDKTENRGTLYNIAKNKKSHNLITFKVDRGIIAANVEEMVARSSGIIIGKALINMSTITNEGDDIITIQPILVQTVLKGEILNGNVIRLKLPGGAWRYSDGTTISKRPTNMRPIQEDNSYILFMDKANANDILWIPSIGVQGIFEIESDTESIIPCDIMNDPIVIKYKNMSLADFLIEIKNSIKSE